MITLEEVISRMQLDTHKSKDQPAQSGCTIEGQKRKTSRLKPANESQLKHLISTFARRNLRKTTAPDYFLIPEGMQFEMQR